MKSRFMPMLTVATVIAASAAAGETLDELVLNGNTRTFTEDSTVATLVVTDGSAANVIEVAAGTTLTVQAYEGGGQLRKAGEGTLVVGDVDPAAALTVGAGKVLFARSFGVETLAAAAAIHLDASKAATVTVQDSPTPATQRITYWYDVRGSDGYAYAQYPTGWGADCYPRYQLGAQNGLNVVDLREAGDSWNKGSFLDMNNFQGTDAEGAESGYGDAEVGIKGVQEIFLVVKDQPGKSGTLYQSFLSDVNNTWNYFFLRGADGTLWNGSVGEVAPLRNGKNWIDGQSVSWNATYPEGFHLLRTQATAAAQRFRTLGRDTTNGHTWQGGLAYGEILIFKSAVDDAVAEKITRRLMHKWFGRQKIALLAVEDGASVEVVAGERLCVPMENGGSIEYTADGEVLVVGASETCVLADGASYPEIRAEGENAKVEVAEGATASVAEVSGTYPIVKTGAGVLEVGDVAPSVRLSVQEGVLRLTRSSGVEDLAGAAAIHLDASKAATVTVYDSPTPTTQRITYWYDVRGSDGYAYAQYPTGWGADCYPRYQLGAQNGLNVVDLREAGDSWTKGSFFDMNNFQGADAEGAESGYGDAEVGIKGVQEIFLVVKDQPGKSGTLYQSFLSDVNNTWNYFFLRGADGTLWNGSVAEVAPLRNGKNWIDGQSVSWNATYPEGFHLLRTQATAAAQRFRTLGRDTTNGHTWQGGLAYGEILIFKSAVDDAVAEKITRRLMHKWFGRQNAAALAVGASGKLEMVSGEKLAVGSAELAQIDVTLGEDQQIVAKSVTLAPTGVVNVKVPSLARGDVPLFTAETLTGTENFENGWQIVCTGRRTTMKPKVVGNTLYGVVEPPGLVIVVE